MTKGEQKYAKALLVAGTELAAELSKHHRPGDCADKDTCTICRAVTHWDDVLTMRDTFPLFAKRTIKRKSRD